ncbi:MAG: glycosyltransferase family 2 protein [Arcticibacter sp.]
MIEKNRLAIVIPAYKLTYFRETLESMSAQECQDFTVYIGDDASPEDLASLVDEYSCRIPIVYRRFEENLGGNDLVAHWERCISMTEGEEWIWLFSDDDVMEASCVKNFYGCMTQVCNAELFHFDLKFIDHGGFVTKICKAFPEYLSVAEFFDRRVGFRLNSTVVEYIFSRTAYEREGGFKNNDLAWCSDDASWIKLGRQTGIVTIPGANVSWRSGGLNISSNIRDKAIVRRKVQANVDHLNWVKIYFEEHGLKSSLKPFAKLKWAISTLVVSQAFSLREKYVMAVDVASQLDQERAQFQVAVYLLYRTMRSKLFK